MITPNSTPDPTPDLIPELSTQPDLDPADPVRYALVSTHLQAMRPAEAAQWSTWCTQHNVDPRRVPVASLIIADDDARTVSYSRWDDYARLTLQITQLEAPARPFPALPMPTGSMSRRQAECEQRSRARDLDAGRVLSVNVPGMRDILDRLDTGDLMPPELRPEARQPLRSTPPAATPESAVQIGSSDPLPQAE